MGILREEWRSVPSFPDYLVSNLGNFKRGIRHRRKRRSSMNGLSQQPGTDGRLRVNVCRNGKYFSVFAHKMVAEAFIGERPSGLQINHIDGNPLNNCADNLEYITQLENVRHARRLGLCCNAVGEENGKAKLTEEVVQEINLLEGVVGAPTIGRRHGITKQAVYGIWLGRTWTHVTGRTPRRNFKAEYKPKIA